MKNKKINSIIALIVVLSLSVVAYLLLQTTGKTTDPTRTTANITYRGGNSVRNQSTTGSAFALSGSTLDLADNYSGKKVSPSISKYQYGTSAAGLQSSSFAQSASGKRVSILGSGSTTSSSVASGGVSMNGGSSTSQYGSSSSSNSSGSSGTSSSFMALSSATIDAPFSSSDVSSNEATTRLDGGPGYNTEPPIGSVLWLLLLALPYVFVKLLIIKD